MRGACSLGAGVLGQPLWSPDGNWLLVSWADANQWVFVRPTGHALVTTASVARRFNPGATGAGTDPAAVGWAPQESIRFRSTSRPPSTSAETTNTATITTRACALAVALCPGFHVGNTDVVGDLRRA